MVTLLPPFLAKVDMFGRDMPGFTLSGKHKITTSLGGLISILVRLTCLLYAANKF